MKKDDIINNIELIILSRNRFANNNAFDKAQRIYNFMQNPEPEALKREKLNAIEEEITDRKPDA